MITPTTVYDFQTLPPALFGAAGGKGGTLARLFQAGYPVPGGLVVLPSAFEGHTLTPAVWAAVLAHLPHLRGPANAALAVRSSAAAEDSAQASFAGSFETVLNVHTEAELRAAIETVFRSQSAARVQAYAAALAVAEEMPGMAVVVQRMVAAEHAGVLFTADPVSGSHAALVGNAVRGLGDRLVSGEADALAFRLARPHGRYSGPPELRRYARQLFTLAQKLEADLDGPQDIEWAAAGGRVALLQARPITTLRTHDPATGEWNDSLGGDYLWTNTNYGEAVPDVMTPATWALLQLFMDELLPLRVPGRHPVVGNVGGRFYMNLSVMAALFSTLGIARARVLAEIEEFYGRLPAGLDFPAMPLAFWPLLKAMVPFGFKAKRRVLAQQRALPAYLAGEAAAAEAVRAQINAVNDPAALAALWAGTVQPAFRHAAQMMQAGTSLYENAARPLRHELEKSVGTEDTHALLSGLSTDGALASLGPVLGLWQVSQGQLSRADFAAQFGHRGAHEFELSWPRPSEDPQWIEAQLAANAQVDVPALLARQQAQHAAAWARYTARYPGRAAAMRRKLDAGAEGGRRREAARSALTRMAGVVRTYLLRAGEITGLGDDIFFLSLAETAAYLRGEDAGERAVTYLPARRETHARYSALPPYPSLIRGRFDPVRWAADPLRRTDVFDAQARPASNTMPESTLTGFAGAAGIVEGRVRVLASVETAGELRPGEILVAATTNIGWTPVFPRAAAVITDVGAPLSHAAIVARELGIPAVVGTGTATMRLRTGDRVRVNGGLGLVELLDD